MDEELKEACSVKSKSRQYYILGHYEILQCGDVEKLIRKRSASDQEPIYFIKRCHVATGCGGCDKIMKVLKKYANVTREAVELYKSLCIECEKKRKHIMTNGVVVRPILSKVLWITKSG